MGHQLHVFFFPMMAHGHMIPTLDVAKLFAARGVRATIVTTPLNASYFSKSVHRANQSGHQMTVRTINFPAAEVGLPENCENMDQVPSHDMVPLFFKATALLQQPFETLLRESRPDCVVADMFFPWATAAAAKFGIPRLVFHGVSLFSLCATASLRLNKPQFTVSSDDEPFVIPNLPHHVQLTRGKLRDQDKEEKETYMTTFLKEVRESEAESFGVLVNSFYELEPDYADHYRNVLGVRAWLIGPVSLCNRETEEKAQRGKEASIGVHECLKWLDSKKPDSVLYVCFGSIGKFTDNQFYELAMALEASGQEFVWVVRREDGGQEEEAWLPEGFEERTRDRGLIIRGWAPQVLILDNGAVGGFVTHCGWNSTLEGICAGLPLVTWPAFAEQFLNEKLVTDVLIIGVGVGVRKWATTSEGIGREAIAEAVKKIMVGEEADEMRKRARALKYSAKKAVEEGGSSHSDLNALLQELSSGHGSDGPN